MSSKKKPGHLMYSLISDSKTSDEEQNPRKNRYEGEAAAFKEQVKKLSEEKVDEDTPTSSPKALEEKPKNEKNEEQKEKSEKKQRIIVPPKDKGESLTKSKIARFTPSFVVRLDKKLKEKNLSYNYLVTQLLEMWLDGEEE